MKTLQLTFHPLFELENLPKGITPLEIPVAPDKVNKMMQFQRKGIIFPSDIFLFLWDTGVVVSLNLYCHDDAFMSAFVFSRVRFNLYLSLSRASSTQG